MADDEAIARQAAIDQEKAIEQFKIKKLIKSLHEARGAGTSMISLVIPPRDQIARVSKMLADEYGTASNIKSRVNRQSVLSAITSTTQRLKLYSKVSLLNLCHRSARNFRCQLFQTFVCFFLAYSYIF